MHDDYKIAKNVLCLQTKNKNKKFDQYQHHGDGNSKIPSGKNQHRGGKSPSGQDQPHNGKITTKSFARGKCPHPSGKCLYPHRVDVISEDDYYDEFAAEDYYQEVNDEEFADS